MSQFKPGDRVALRTHLCPTVMGRVVEATPAHDGAVRSIFATADGHPGSREYRTDDVIHAHLVAKPENMMRTPVTHDAGGRWEYDEALHEPYCPGCFATEGRQHGPGCRVHRDEAEAQREDFTRAPEGSRIVPPAPPCDVTETRASLKVTWETSRAAARTQIEAYARAGVRIAAQEAAEAAIANMDPRERFPVGSTFTHEHDEDTRHRVVGHHLLADGGCALLRGDGYLSRASECEPWGEQ